MKRIISTLAALAMLIPLAAQNPGVLVAFFSRAGDNYAVGNVEQGNTSIVADMIAERTGADLFEIKPATPYPAVYAKCTEVARKEKESGARPAIKANIHTERYDTIYIGYPIWWGESPMAVLTFLESHDWNGKTVIPFCTHEGSGLSGTDAVTAACKGATIAEGLAIKGSDAQNERESTRKKVNAWVDKIANP